MIVSPDNDDQMQLLMFIDNITRVANLFGVQVFKQDYVLQRIANKMNEDYDNLFAVDEGAAMNAMLQQLVSQQNQNATQVNNPAQQTNNARRVTPLSAAKVT